ncbi:MAG: hypothetical protein KDA96_00015 [Planctomycetaceae bacterium]|nr:hypothetical protein [Planctomycetaceae bacterium]
MANGPKAESLLQRVESRLKLASLTRAIYLSSLATLAAGCAGVIAVRLLGLIPKDQQRMEWALLLPAVAVLVAFLTHKRVVRQVAARRIDQHAGTDDLFLTLATLDSSAGEYQPLVSLSAEQKAESIEPTVVVPFRVQRPILHLVSVLTVLILLFAFVPQLDPFGKLEAVERSVKAKKELTVITRAAKERTQQLEQKALIASERNDEIEKEIGKMLSDFRQMKPKEREANSRVLGSHRSDLNDQWKMVNSDQLREMLSQQISSQQFGGERSQKMNDWLKELQQGDTTSLQKEMDEAQETMHAMMNAETAEDRQRLASQLRRQLQDMKRFSSDKASSPELASALDRALKALEAAAQKSENGEPSGSEMSQEAAEALQETLKQAAAELQDMARNAKDMQRLEQAMEALRRAESLNRNGQLDGEQCEGCQSLADYAELYKKMMKGQGNGEGMGNKGFGKGGEAQEDDSDPEGYKDEKSKTQLQAGKTLLSIKTKEHATEKDFDPADLENYNRSIQSVKAGVESAIEAEEIPPGYVDGIKGYFDNIQPAAAP